MEVLIAKTAGFCFGVNNAVKVVKTLIDKEKNKKIYTFGPIIHNDQVILELEEKGVKVIENLDNLPEPGIVVIRAHGVSPHIYDKLKHSGFEVIDATCPYVSKIQKLAMEKNIEGYQIIIVGDSAHPEVIGINGWTNNNSIIINSVEDAEKIPESVKKLCVVAQTTITKEKWNNINEYLKKRFEIIIKFDTICSATSKRQAEADDLSKKADLMLVVGSKNSSNTQKLFEICNHNCKNTIYIETSGDIKPMDIKKIKITGITAGASTPDWVIEEVKRKMDEFNANEQEISFKDAFESSLVTLHSGEIVKGKIIGYNNSEIYVDMGYKSDGVISIDEFSDDPDFSPEKSLKPGDEIEVFIVRVNDNDGNVQLSKKRVDSIKNWDKMEEAFESKAIIKGKIVDIVKGGVIALCDGVRVFIPASQISDRFVKDLAEFLKKPVELRIVEINKFKKRLVGSARTVIEEQKAASAGAVWSVIEIGKKFTGHVKSLTDFGAFVDIGGVDGLIHMSEISWLKIKHPSEILKVGQEVEVTILDFDKEKSRISLGFRKSEENPWTVVASKLNVGDIINGKVLRLVPFGAFVEIEKGIDGLVHISQISNVRISKPDSVLKVGQVVEAKITEINIEAKKIGLSIKEVNPIDPVKELDAKTEEPVEELPTEHKEELSNTISESIKE